MWNFDFKCPAHFYNLQIWVTWAAPLCHMQVTETVCWHCKLVVTREARLAQYLVGLLSYHPPAASHAGGREAWEKRQERGTKSESCIGRWSQNNIPRWSWSSSVMSEKNYMFHTVLKFTPMMYFVFSYSSMKYRNSSVQTLVVSYIIHIHISSGPVLSPVKCGMSCRVASHEQVSTHNMLDQWVNLSVARAPPWSLTAKQNSYVYNVRLDWLEALFCVNAHAGVGYVSRGKGRHAAKQELHVTFMNVNTCREREREKLLWPFTYFSNRLGELWESCESRQLQREMWHGGRKRRKGRQWKEKKKHNLFSLFVYEWYIQAQFLLSDVAEIKSIDGCLGL